MSDLKLYFLSALIIAIVAINAPCQRGDNSICGNIEDGQLTIPSYRFLVIDKKGQAVDNLRVGGVLNITEGIWVREGGISGHWRDVNHDLYIPITHDSTDRLYVSREIRKVKIAHRKKGGFLGIGSGCWDRVRSLFFRFTAPNGDSGSFHYHFPNKTIDKISLPDPQRVIKVVLK